MLFSLVLLVLPPGGDGSKIARFGEWQNGEGAFFHNLTIAWQRTAAYSERLQPCKVSTFYRFFKAHETPMFHNIPLIEKVIGKYEYE